MGFFFGSDANPNIGPGKNNDFVLIATDAKNYNSSGTMSIGGSNLNGEGTCTPFDVNHCRGGQIHGLFAPTNAPEPSSALLFGLGLGGLAALRKRLV